MLTLQNHRLPMYLEEMAVKKMIMTTLVVGLAMAWTATGGQLLSNGDFASIDLGAWKLYNKKGEPASTPTVADGVLQISVAAASQPHVRPLMQEVPVASETAYRVSFDMKTAGPGGEEVNVVLARSKDWSEGHYGLFRKVTPCAAWETHSFTFTTKVILPDNPAMLKFNLGGLGGDVFLRNIVLTERQP
jgi:hypothetical protein